MSVPLASLGKRSVEQRAKDARVFERVSGALAEGRSLATLPKDAHDDARSKRRR
jgi:hypothetical protein